MSLHFVGPGVLSSEEECRLVEPIVRPYFTPEDAEAYDREIRHGEHAYAFWIACETKHKHGLEFPPVVMTSIERTLTDPDYYIVDPDISKFFPHIKPYEWDDDEE